MAVHKQLNEKSRFDGLDSDTFRKDDDGIRQVASASEVLKCDNFNFNSPTMAVVESERDERWCDVTSTMATSWKYSPSNARLSSAPSTTNVDRREDDAKLVLRANDGDQDQQRVSERFI